MEGAQISPSARLIIFGIYYEIGAKANNAQNARDG
jgi:hypothetical protein